jgi:cytosine/adenosine deaminase-related metal-dependent hydrolase
MPRLGPELIRAEYLVSDPELGAEGVIRDAALVVEQERIAAIGPWAELGVQYGDLQALTGPADCLVLPGLVNAHHHGRGVSTLMAGMADLPLERWLTAFLQYPQVDTYWDTRYAAARQLRSGITTSIHSHSGSGPMERYRQDIEATLSAYRDTGARVTFAMGLYDQNQLVYAPDDWFFDHLPPGLRNRVGDECNYEHLYIDADDYFRLFEELLSQVATAFPLVSLMLSPCGLQWSSEQMLGRMVNAARTYDVGLHYHIAETMYQRAYLQERFGKPVVAALERAGLLGPHVSLAHAIWFTEADLPLLAKTGTTVVTNPSSNLRLGSGILPLNALRQQGVPMAIGLDSGSLSDDEDMLREMRLLSTLHREPGIRSDWPQPYEVLAMATVGGARAAQLEGQVGKLLPGYKADLVSINLGRIRRPYVAPNVDLVALALARGTHEDIDTVMVEGRILKQAGKLVGTSLSQIEDNLVESIFHDSERVQRASALLRELKPFLREFYKELEPTTLQPFYCVNGR